MEKFNIKRMYGFYWMIISLAIQLITFICFLCLIFYLKSFDSTNANQEAGDNSYRFSGGDYKLTSKALSEGYENLYTSIGSEGIIDFYCDGSKSFIGNYCTASSKYYSLNYDGSKHYDTLLNALDKLESDGYITRDEIKNFWLDLTKDKAEDVITFISSALHPTSSSFFEAKYGISEDTARAIYYTALAFFVYSAENDKNFPRNLESIQFSNISLSNFTSNN